MYYKPGTVIAKTIGKMAVVMFHPGYYHSPDYRCHPCLQNKARQVRSIVKRLLSLAT